MTLKLHHRLLLRSLLAYSRLARGMTLGVRAMLIKDDHVALVKHTYVPGWHFPGGGVEAGENVVEALDREILEEVGAILTGRPQLFGLYQNKKVHRRDHVALFVCRDWERPRPFHGLSWEISAAEMFPLNALPPDATPATLARIREVIGGEPASPDW